MISNTEQSGDSKQTNQSTQLPPKFDKYATEELTQASAFGPGKHGIFEATLSRKEGGETRLLREYTKVPYHLTGTLNNDPAPGLTTLCLQDPTGGVVQGDRHQINITARDRTRAHITAQSATKVQSMRANFAHLDTKITAGADSYVEYFPGATLLNQNSRCLQTLTVDLSETGVVLVSDIFSADGLTAHEPFDFDHYMSRVTARVDDKLVCTDTIELQPQNGKPDDQATLAEFQSIGSLYIFAPSQTSQDLADKIYTEAVKPIQSDEKISEEQTKGNCTEELALGVSTLPFSAGTIVRLLGHRTTDVQEGIRKAWSATREVILDEPIPKDRRY